ncbi:hypothetical protein [Telluribacter sp. SYSU D00476]|uniref:hypothetical protein n=1 Tax=Telluribacter sp. SYSU D00476 TaxID=2811430 RepID=UPI001FF128E7|nr:hypothetical protein [Telluribacter sp. SYSU D00476]
MRKLHTRLALFLFVLFSCQFTIVVAQQKPTAKVLIDCNYCAGQQVAANVADPFSNGFTLLEKTQADSAGQASLTIPVSDPLFAYITIGPGVLGQDSVYNLYLEPDQVLTLSIKNDKVHYTGQLSVVNEYLVASGNITNKVWDTANALVGQFSKFTKEEQDKVLESFNKQLVPLHQTIINDSRLSP